MNTEKQPPLKGTSTSTHHSPRYLAAQKATWISALLNLILTLLQIVVGWWAHSQSLVAHGLHSFSDLLSDFLVLVANRQGANPADNQHPYGHARFETAATLILGVSLIGVGSGILWESFSQVRNADDVLPVAWPAFWVAVFTVIFKEGLYRYLMAVARRFRSPLLTANALHTRADAASALVVVFGIAGSLWGWAWLDLAAAALMGGMIFHMGGRLAWEALSELIDTGLEDETVANIRDTLIQTPGVQGVHELRTRRMAHQALVDAHIQVGEDISVSEGHFIAELARTHLLESFEDVRDVLIHIDPEDDMAVLPSDMPLPTRLDIAAIIEPAMVELEGGNDYRVQIHYLQGGILVDLFLPGCAAIPKALQPKLQSLLLERFPLKELRLWQRL